VTIKLDPTIKQDPPLAQITSADQISDGIITAAKLAQTYLTVDAQGRANLFWSLTKKEYKDNLGSGVFWASDTEGNTTSTTYVMGRFIVMNRTPDSSLHTSFDLYDGNAPNGLVYGRIYRGDTAVGTEHSTNSATWVTFQDTTSGWTDNTTLRLYVHCDASSVKVYYRYLRILATLQPEFLVSG
jgi:hypothetical protein